MGRSRRSTVAPIFRSDAQGRVLSAVFLASEGKPVHVREIATRTGVPYSTVQREVDRLVDAGVLRTEAFANAKVVRPNRESPYFRELESLVTKTYGPATMIAEALVNERGVADAYIFGSWAARYHGDAGPTPGDIDVVIVVDEDADTTRIEDAVADATRALSREVNVVFTDVDDWATASSAFLRTIKSRPLVGLASHEH